MRHEMLTERALFSNTKRDTLTQHFVTHVVPPLDVMVGHLVNIIMVLTVCRAMTTGGFIC